MPNASAIDGIQTEVLRSEICIDLLFKIISHAFTQGRVPSDWSKGIIKPLPKGEDLRNHLSYVGQLPSFLFRVKFMPVF